MNKLETLVVNPFFTIEVSRGKVQQFVYDHIQRSTGFNIPAFAPFILETTTLWESLFGNIETYKDYLHDQVSLSKEVKNITAEFSEKALKLEYTVLSHYEKGGTVYREFYPFGRSEFHNITQPNILMLMDRMVTKSAKYAGDVGPTWETDFIDIRTRFQAIFADQKQMIGQVDGKSSDYEAQLSPLYVQLFKNICTIMAYYPDKPDRMLDFFNQTIANHETHVKVVTLPKNTNTAADITFTEIDILQIRSKSSFTLQYFFAPAPDSVPPETPFNLAANEVIEVNCSTIGLPENCFLIFINTNVSEGKVELLLK